jgi:hypothetical protein
MPHELFLGFGFNDEPDRDVRRTSMPCYHVRSKFFVPVLCFCSRSIWALDSSSSSTTINAAPGHYRREDSSPFTIIIFIIIAAE